MSDAPKANLQRPALDDLRTRIEAAWDDSASLEPSRDYIETAVDLLDLGEIRTAERVQGTWQVNEWVKKAIILYMRLRGHENIGVRGASRNETTTRGGFGMYPLKAASRLQRVFMPVPSVIRHGSYIADDARILVSFVSMGVWIGQRTMVVNGASVGLCAQVGADVFVAPGASVGSVCQLPLNARPVIVEDGAYIGSHCVVSEGTDPYFDHPATTADQGVIVGAGAVLGANVVINGATPLIDVSGDEAREIWGLVPPNAVVVPGTVDRELSAGRISVYAPLIIGWRDEGDDLQQSLHDALHKYRVAA
jgi:2,3,4,5-tetrahydropyridine-2,6-dicarboxylate N-succinyltransferase